MKKAPKTKILIAFLCFSYLGAAFGFYLLAWGGFCTENAVTVQEKYSWLVALFYLGLTLFLLRTYSAFRVSYFKPRRLIFSQTIANIVAIVIVYFAVSLVWGKCHNPVAFVVLLFGQILFNIFWSYLADALWFRIHTPLKTYILYKDKESLARLDAIYSFTRKFSVVGEIPVTGRTFEDLLKEIPDAEALFVVGITEELRNELMLICLEKGIEGFFQPEIHDIIQSGATQVHSFGTPLMGVAVPTPDPIYMVVKRICAFVLSLILLILLSPILIGAALAIRIFDPTGPVIFTQQRMGRNMKPFTCYKFRTMSTKAPHDCHPRDFDAQSFLTPLGKFLRESSIDELPQIFNILKGDMCFIGPRPIPLTEETLIAHRGMLGVYNLYPGISGLAQVSGRNAVNDTEKLFFDYEYLLKFSPLLDIKIFFRTVLFVLMRQGVYVKKTGK